MAFVSLYFLRFPLIPIPIVFFSYFLPLAPIRRRRRGRTYTESGPMFPRYLFIHLGEGIDDWGPIRSTVGISTLVRFGQVPAHVPERLITELRSREDSKGVLVIPAKVLKKRQELRISEGPFEGYEGLFEANSGKDRVIILLKILEKQARIEIERYKVEAIQ